MDRPTVDQRTTPARIIHLLRNLLTTLLLGAIVFAQHSFQHTNAALAHEVEWLRAAVEETRVVGCPEVKPTMAVNRSTMTMCVPPNTAVDLDKSGVMQFPAP